MDINMTTQGGVKLGTAGKYCPEDINVIPQLKPLTVTPAKSAQNIAAPDGKVGYSSVTVEKIPDDYIIPSGSQNITANGTYDVTSKASVVVNVDTAKPTLNAPSISISGTTLTITNPASNGNFVTSYTLYNGSTAITTTTSKTIDLSTYITTAGTYTLTVKAKGTNFNDSASSNSVTYTLKSQITPVISLVSGTTIQIDTIDDNATTIEVFADGVSIGSVSKQ